LVNSSLRCATRPEFDDSSQSTDNRSIGWVADLIFLEEIYHPWFAGFLAVCALWTE